MSVAEESGRDARRAGTHGSVGAGASSTSLPMNSASAVLKTGELSLVLVPGQVGIEPLMSALLMKKCSASGTTPSSASEKAKARGAIASTSTPTSNAHETSKLRGEERQATMIRQ